MIPTRLLSFLLFFLIMVCLLVTGACNKTEENNSEEKSPKAAVKIEPTVKKTGGIYRIPLRSNPATLDPAKVRDLYGGSLVYQLYDGLVRFDRYLSVMPALAKTWRVEDNGKVYRFFLQPHAIFHDGTPIRVDDVIFSLSRLLRVENAQAILPHLLKIEGAQAYKAHTAETVTGLEAVDDHTLVVRLTAPHIPFLTALGICYAKIIPRGAATRLGQDFGKTPVGSGPFRFVSWNADAMIQLERFPDYYGDTALVDEIQYKIYPGGKDEEILTDFQSNDLDEMPVFGNVRQSLPPAENLQWVHRSSLSLFFYGMNTNHPHLKNKKLRKALALAIDRQAIVKEIYNGQYDMATTILPPGMPGYTPDNQMKANNMAMAQTLVKQIRKALPHPLPALEIVSATQSPSSMAELALVQKTWGKLGIHLNIKYITDWTEFENYLNSDAVQIYRYAWFADMPEPDNFLYALFGSDSPVNFMRYNCARVDEMFTTARQTVGAVERSTIYRGIESILLESFPLIPLFYMSVDRVYQPQVKGITVSALGAHTMTLNNIWLNPPN
ncbi:MAG: ABC transporter substrate-binding protein [Desulfobacterium sp.]